MRDVGVITREYQKLTFALWLATHTDDREKLSVELNDVVPIFVILAVGTASSLALLLVENCRHLLPVLN
jgi:hypothetical protein